MKKRKSLIDNISLLLLILGVLSNLRADTGLPKYAPGSLVVEFTTAAYLDNNFDIHVVNNKIETNLNSVDSLNSYFVAKSVKPYYTLVEESNPLRMKKNRKYILQFSAKADMEKIAEVYRSNENIESAHPNWLYYIDVTPNDNSYSNQWSLPKIDCPSAWDIQNGSSNVMIGIIDTGVDLDHPDLQSKLASSAYRRDEVDIDTDSYTQDGYTLDTNEDYTTADSDPQDRHGHGSHVAGIAAAATNNTTGIAGVAWNSKIMPLRAGFRIYDGYNWVGVFEQDDVERIIDWAESNGADILNMSFGASTLSDYADAIEDAYDSGIVMFASSGNANTTPISYPARLNDYVIAVGATNADDDRCDPTDWGTGNGSNYGAGLDIVAPGDDIYSTVYNDTYAYKSGTSMATPHAAGVAALLLSNDSNLTPAQIRTILELTADDLGATGKDNYYGYGRINAYNAVRITTSGTLPDNEVWRSTVTLTDNVTVPSGVTLTILPGTVVSVPNGKKIQVNGLLKANDVTFTGSSWYGIEFDDASTGSYIKYSTIQYATYGIRMISTNVSLTCNTVKNNGTGFYFDDHSDGSSIVNGNDISYNSSCGIRCASYSDPLIFTFNDIQDNGIGLGGVSGDGSSIPDLGRYSDQGHNNIYNNDWYDVNSSYSGTIYARYNYWGSSNPSPYVSSNVDWSSYLTSMAKANLADAAPNQPPAVTLETEYTDTLGISEVDAAYSQYYQEKNYLDAATAFENIVNKYPDHFAGKRALSFLYKSQKHQKNDAAIRPLLDQIIATYSGKAVADLAQHLTVSELLKQAEFTEAAYKCQALLEKENEFTKYALLKLGNIYWYHLKDKARGEKYYRELITAYPDHDLSISALATLGEWNPEAPKQPDSEPKDIAGNSNVKKFALLQNYPNPFNPTTTIPYQIAEDGPVSIKIFNILGEEVATLLNGDAAAGSHAIQWNGLNKYGQLVANGVYWVQLQSGQLISRRKVVMLQ